MAPPFAALALALVSLLALAAVVTMASGTEIVVELWRVSLQDVVSFRLRDSNGNLVGNDVHELPEQIAMARFIRRGDVVLNVGGNVGTSCIAAELISHPPGKGDAQPHTLCVEPNERLVPHLAANFEGSGTKAIQILNGVLTDVAHCPVHLPVFGSGGEQLPAVDGGDCDRIPGVFTYNNESYDVRACYTLDYVAWAGGGKLPDVVAGDCEGCMPDVLRLVGFRLPGVRVVTFERDGGEAAEPRYLEMEAGLAADGFDLMQDGWITTWERGPHPLIFRPWVLFSQLVVPAAACYALDAVAERWSSAHGHDTRAVAPFWRVLAVPLRLFWERSRHGEIRIGDWALVGGFPVPRLYRQSSWYRRGFRGVAGFAFAAVALLWPSLRLLTVDRRWALASCAACLLCAVGAGAVWMELSGATGSSNQPQGHIEACVVVGALGVSVYASIVQGRGRRHEDVKGTYAA